MRARVVVFFAAAGLCSVWACGAPEDSASRGISPGSIVPLGGATTNPPPPPGPQIVLGTTVMVVTGRAHTCALWSLGQISCWGDNTFGQLGLGFAGIQPKPIPPRVVPSLSGVLSITAGRDHTCALLQNGSVQCWGDNSSFQLGKAASPTPGVPVVVSGLLSASAIAAGGRHTCVITNAVANGFVQCWGDNTNGQLGNGTNVSSGAPVGVALPGTSRIAAGRAHTCAIGPVVQPAGGGAASGPVRCWGDNADGALGDGTYVSKSSPVSVLGLAPDVNRISLGRGFSCAIVPGGRGKCWGSNFDDKLAAGFAGPSSPLPLDIMSLPDGASQIGLSQDHACAITLSGAMECWGRNDRGQVGDKTLVQKSFPTPVSGAGGSVTALSTGHDDHTCAIVSSQLFCWGANDAGQVGDGTIADRSAPAAVLYPTN